MITRTFGSFTFDVVEKMFNIQEVNQLPLLEEWLSAPLNINEHQKYELDRLKKHLVKKANIWNEDEFKMFFIGPLIEVAEIGNDIFQAFTQRSFSIKIDEEEIGGRVDFLIAKGRRVPELPYFCIHEYICTEPSRSEQEADNSGDPIGQLLIAMMAARQLNENKHPLLGAYVIGRLWFFVVTDNQQYAKSTGYDATKDDIFQIFAILQKSNDIIGRYV